jgi:AraC-like DNA-binding protein
MTHGRSALVFGPQSRRMPIRVEGSFVSVGMAFRPGSMAALGFGEIARLVDRIVPVDSLGVATSDYLEPLSACTTAESMALAVENVLRRNMNFGDARGIDPVTTRFERLAFTDPGANIADFARECGIDKRTLERIVRRDFGMSPKQVLRRARALDMASHLRGVADAAEADELALRYYDQSHLIHEFAELFGVSPRQFVATPQPILTLALESRQARRLEAIARLAPGAKRPWE